MKYALIPLLALAVKGCPVGSTGENLIVNGNFSQNKCPSAWCIFNKKNYHQSVKAWLPDPELEIGNGNVYSSYFGKQRVLELDGNANTCAKQIISHVAPGFYKLSVSHAARKGVALSDNVFKIQFNGNTLKTVTPTDYLVHTTDIEIQVNSDLQDASLRLCGDGKNNGLGAIVNQVKMVRIYKNLINNGDLQINTCNQEWCVYDYSNYANQVQGWLPDPELEIGYGYLYTSKLNKQRVMELDGNKNTCAKQIVPLLTSGLYQFQVTYGARSNVPLTTDNQFSIKFNGKVLKKVVPTSYDLQKQVIEITVQSDLRNVELQLCGQGQSNGLGAFIKSTKLIKTDSKYPFSIRQFAVQAHTQPMIQHFLPQISEPIIATKPIKIQAPILNQTFIPVQQISAKPTQLLTPGVRPQISTKPLQIQPLIIEPVQMFNHQNIQTKPIEIQEHQHNHNHDDIGNLRSDHSDNNKAGQLLNNMKLNNLK